MALAANAGGVVNCPTEAEDRTEKKSFAEILAGRTTIGDVPFRLPTTYDNLPAIVFTEEEERILTESLKYALIGKFSRGLPVFKEIHPALTKLGLRGPFTVGAMKPGYVLINPSLEEDYARLWVKQEWFIAGRMMRLFKWSPSFTYAKESAIAPVWVNLPNLPPHLFTKGELYSIASYIGKPVKVDEATANRTRPSVARVCVEVNLLEPTAQEVTIKSGVNIYKQKIFFENRPQFCNLCNHRGHLPTTCFSNGLNLHHPKTTSLSQTLHNNPQHIQPAIQQNNTNTDQLTHGDTTQRQTLTQKQNLAPNHRTQAWLKIQNKNKKINKTHLKPRPSVPLAPSDTPPDSLTGKQHAPTPLALTNPTPDQTTHKSKQPTMSPDLTEPTPHPQPKPNLVTTKPLSHSPRATTKQTPKSSHHTSSAVGETSSRERPSTSHTYGESSTWARQPQTTSPTPPSTARLGENSTPEDPRQLRSGTLPANFGLGASNNHPQPLNGIPEITYVMETEEDFSEKLTKKRTSSTYPQPANEVTDLKQGKKSELCDSKIAQKMLKLK